MEATPSKLWYDPTLQRGLQKCQLHPSSLTAVKPGAVIKTEALLCKRRDKLGVSLPNANALPISPLLLLHSKLT